MSKDRFGFGFWLGWILRFAGGLVVAAAVWTGVITWALGKIEGPELILTWSVAVFGSWFLLLIPFMRKKEQIWKRLNQDQEKAVDAWLRAMGIFIGLLIVSSLFWSWWYREPIAASSSRFPIMDWTKAVLGTWMALLMPFLILMYRKADQIFREATERQLQAGPKFRTAFLEKSQRLLPKAVSEKLKNFPPTLREGHIVNLDLLDGRRIPHVFVLNKQEILGIYDQENPDFVASDVKDLQPVAPGDLPAYDESKWLRLDTR